MRSNNVTLLEKYRINEWNNHEIEVIVKIMWIEAQAYHQSPFLR